MGSRLVLYFFIFHSIFKAFGRKKYSVLKNFRTWIENCNFPVNKLEVVYIDDFYEYGAIAKENISLDDLYLSVPSHCIVKDDLVFENVKIGKAMKEVRSRLGRDNFYEILLFLIAESKNENSFWKPYFEILPDSFKQLPMYFTSADVEFFGMKWLIDEIDGYKKKIEKGWETVQQRIIAYHNKVFESEVFNWESFQWAWHILDSRSIWFNGKRHLVPLLDMINCCGDTEKLRPVFDLNQHKTTEDKEKNAITFSAANFKKNDQVFENYGQPNKIYYFYHGFFINNNHQDCVTFNFHLFNSSDPIFKERKEFAEFYFENSEFSTEEQEFCLDVANPIDARLELLIKISIANFIDGKPDFASVSESKVYKKIISHIDAWQNFFARPLQVLYLNKGRRNLSPVFEDP